MRTVLPSVLLILLGAQQVFAQEQGTPVSIGKKINIQSAVLGETREIFIAGPEKSPRPLPVVLVFDGESLFTPVVAAVRFMNYSSEIPQMPEAYVVGIANTIRFRDMPIPQEFGKGKGEDKFFQFIVDELIPDLKKKYALNGHVIVIGHSQGAYFASYMMTKNPSLFPWVVALDAPMTVSPQTTVIKQAIAALVNNKDSMRRYISVESVFGWQDEWAKYLSANSNLKQDRLNDEGHESMAFKGVYDGLKFLYRDYPPQQKDMRLADLQLAYRNISRKYGYDYDVPLRVLQASASRKLPENRKKEIIDLLQYAENLYGSTPRITKLKEEAARINKEPDPLVDMYLSHPKPTPEQVKKYIGRWVGELKVPRGTDMIMDIEILVEDGVVKFFSILPWDRAKRVAAEIFLVDKDGRLVFGRKNRGSGIIIATAEFSSPGVLTGKEQWIGADIPEEAPPEAKEMMRFTMNNPNTFRLTKVQ